MGGHSLGVADVDGDGRDEIVYQAMVIDDDGKGLHTSGLRHGDAMHVSDLDPDRPGQEIYTVQENEGSMYDRTTPLRTKHRLTTLMHDSQYRLGIAWQNVVYNKPPHPSFFLGDGMKPPPRVEITTE